MVGSGGRGWWGSGGNGVWGLGVGFLGAIR